MTVCMCVTQADVIKLRADLIREAQTRPPYPRSEISQGVKPELALFIKIYSYTQVWPSWLHNPSDVGLDEL